MVEVAETVAEEISTEALEEEMIPMMEIGIVQSAIIPISQDVLNAIDVASHVLAAEVVEAVDVEILIEALEIEEMAVDVEILIGALEIEEMVEVEESEENSLAVTKIERNLKKIIFVSQRVKEQVMPTTTHQNL